MTIKAITFDFWSTLYKPKTIDYTERLYHLKETVETHSGASLSIEQFKEAVTVARERWSQAWMEEYRTIMADEWLTIVLNELDISLPTEPAEAIQKGMEESVLNDRPTLVPEAKVVLADLSSEYQLGIISDTGITPGRILRQLLEEDGIVTTFSHLTFSDEIGCSKPHPDAFTSTLQALGAEASEGIHIGDLLRTDIAGAQDVGMRGVQYVGVSYDQKQSSLASVTPDAIIEAHTELRGLIASWT